ncbi:hypothetical protein U3516DRAFT_753627 [Neocallimastix sp. 'constans']
MIFMRVENYNNNYFIETPDINVINRIAVLVIKLYCMFIDKTTIVHNDDTYSNTLFLGGRSHMPLGKPPDNGPSDSNSMEMFIEALVFIEET